MDYVPIKDAAFAAWIKSLLAYLQVHLSASNIQDSVFQSILALNTAWETAYAKALNPNKGLVAEKNHAWEALEKTLRNFIKAFLLYSPFVSDKHRSEMQLPIHHSTPVPPPATFPEYSVDSSVPNRLTVRFWDAATKQLGKPHGIHGVEIRWELREDVPAKAEDLVNSDFTIRSPYTFVFTGDKQGKRVYFYLCWDNNKGEKYP